MGNIMADLGVFSKRGKRSKGSHKYFKASMFILPKKEKNI
jgi:hypothetical protein